MRACIFPHFIAIWIGLYKGESLKKTRTKQKRSVRVVWRITRLLDIPTWVDGALREGTRGKEGNDVFFLGGASLICPPINGRGPIWKIPATRAGNYTSFFLRHERVISAIRPAPLPLYRLYIFIYTYISLSSSFVSRLLFLSVHHLSHPFAHLLHLSHPFCLSACIRARVSARLYAFYVYCGARGWSDATIGKGGEGWSEITRWGDRERGIGNG